MSAIRSLDNRTERAVRKRLHALGFRYRKYDEQLPGKPDMIFPASRVAVFIDGDYWHARVLVDGGPAVLRRAIGERPTANYWIDKFTRRALRDREVTLELRRMGWAVIRVWESEARKDIEGCVQAIAKRIRAEARRIRLQAD